MEVDQPNRRMNLGQCQTKMCSLDSQNICLTHRVIICNICAAVLHYECNLKIKEGEMFVIEVIQILKNLVERIEDQRVNCGSDNSFNRDHKEELYYIKDQIEVFEGKIKKDFIHAWNVGSFVSKTLMLAKDIFESQVYRAYTDYLSKLKISKSFANKLDDDTGEIGLYGIRTRFYLNAKKKEMDFCENKLKALAQEMTQRVTQVQQDSILTHTDITNQIKQQSESSKNDVGVLQEMLLNMFGLMKEETKSNFEDIHKKIDSQREQFEKSNELNKQQHEELKQQNQDLKSTLNQLKIKVEGIENKQQAIKKEMEDLGKEIDTKHMKQDEKSQELNQRINEIELESKKSISEIKSLIGDISKKIEISKEDLKEYAEKCDLKIKSVESSIQKDLDKKQEDYHQLIEKCDKNNSESHFELAQRVETLEVKLAPVAEFVGEQIQERDRLLYEEHQKIMEEQERILMQEEEQRERIRLEEEQKQMELKRIQEEEEKKQAEERQAKMIEDLKLKDEEYYIEEFKDIKEFPTAFKKTREVYSKLGQHIYPHQLDFSRPVQIKRGTTKGGKKYIYFGQLEEETDKRDGVGISVYCSGRICEGCWKNDKQNGLGRSIFKDGDYYIGEFKDGDRHGQGTYWYNDGRKYVGEYKNGQRTGQGIYCLADGSKHVGEFVNGKYHGEGSEYTADGQISREGVWAEGKYVGKGSL